MKKVKQKSKRFLSMLLAVLMLCTSPMSALAEDMPAENVVVTDMQEELLSGTEGATTEETVEAPVEVPAELPEQSTTENTENVEETETPEATEAPTEETAEPTEAKTYANGLPSTIAAGETFTLDQDYIMESGQWFEKIEGTLDGNGHTITLTDKPLANVVTETGVIQNLGVTSENVIDYNGTFGSMAVTFSGTIQNCYSTAKLGSQKDVYVGGLVGEFQAGIITNSYFAGEILGEKLFKGGFIGYSFAKSVPLTNCAYVGDYEVCGGTEHNLPECESVLKNNADEMKAEDTLNLLNKDIVNTDLVWILPEDDSNYGMPILGEKIVVAESKAEVDEVTTEGVAEEPDIDALVQKGINAAEAHFEMRYPTDYSFSAEWVVYGLLRAGKTIPQEKLDSYYQNVEEKVKGWEATQKATDIERTVLALQVMGKDITNVGGKNLVEMICNHDGLLEGSNEVGWALLALDAKNTKVPSGAKWTKDKMVAGLLTFQNESGGFGLIDNKSAGIDTTAMALQALAPYRESKPEVETAIQKGLAYLKSVMLENCDYGSSESNSQVILTLTTLGINPIDSEFGTKTNNLILTLVNKYSADNGFGHTDNTVTKYGVMSSIQAHQALISYVNFKNGEKTYWELGKEETPEPPVEPEEVGTITLYIMDGILKEQSHLLPIMNQDQATFKLYGKKEFEKMLFGFTSAEKDKEIPTKGIIFHGDVKIYKDDTASSIIQRACDENGIEIVNSDGTYIESIAGLKEFDRGQHSGWKYSVDGEFPNKGVALCSVENGDIKDKSVVTVEYTNKRLGKDLGENADLQSLDITGGKLVEEFKRDQYEYHIEATEDLIFTPQMHNRYSLVTIEADEKTYDPGDKIPLKDGDVITLISKKNVRGEDVKTYKFTVKDVLIYENADIEAPNIEGGTLEGEFDRDQYVYTIVTDSDSISLDPKMFNRYGTVRISVNGKIYQPGEKIPVEDGTVITVLARKEILGKDEQIYTFTVRKKEKDIIPWIPLEPAKPIEKPGEQPKPEEPEKITQLVDKTYGIAVAGEDLVEGVELKVKQLGKDDEDVKRMRKEIPSSKSLYRRFDIKLVKDGKEVELTEPLKISIPVGKKYDGETLTVLHCMSDKVEKLTGKVEHGIITFQTNSLSSFGVVVDTAKLADQTNATGGPNGGTKPAAGGAGARPTGGAAAKTGDTSQSTVWMTMLLLSTGVILLASKRRKEK